MLDLLGLQTIMFGPQSNFTVFPNGFVLDNPSHYEAIRDDFLAWYSKEKDANFWFNDIKECPKQLPLGCIEVPYYKTLEYRLWQINHPHETALWPEKITVQTFVSPDEDEWELVELIGENQHFFGDFFHPSGVYELRSKKVNPKLIYRLPDGKYAVSGNQCIYDAKGRLCTEIPTAGTIDKVSPLFSIPGHFLNDVLPFLAAKFLGEEYIKLYYIARPSK